MKPFISLTHDELTRLLSMIVKHGDTRFYVLVLLGLSHGLRISEILSLTKSNFTTTSDGRLFLTVQRLKGSQQTCQQVAAHPDVLFDEQAAVSKYLASLPSEKLFSLSRSGADFLFKRYSEWAGLAKMKRHCHVLKHSLGNLMRQAGCDVVTIQHSLGHTDIRSTLQYLRPSSDEIEAARLKAFAPVTPYTHATHAAAAAGK